MTILASFAQEESRSISENIRWRIKKQFEKGNTNGQFRVYGYRWEEDNLVVVHEEAAVVRRIFQNFLDGKSRLETEREFAAEGITTRNGYRWMDSNIKVVLTNVTYTGNMLFQKEYVTDPILKKRKKNRGELPKYYVENTHEPIIDKETFDYVQQEMARRKKLGALANKSLNTTCFTGKIKCGQCGGWYGAKVWHSIDKYRRTIYRCNDKFKSHCQTLHLTEDDIREVFIRATNQLIENKADILNSIILLKERLTDTEALEEERDKLSTDLNLLADKVQQLIAKNARVAQNQDDYDRNYSELVSRYEAVKKQYDKTCEAIQYRKARSRQMDSFIKTLRAQTEPVAEFDERLWGCMVDYVTVGVDGGMTVVFRDGTGMRG